MEHAVDWPAHIGSLILIKEALYKLEGGRFWEYSLPEVAANESDLLAMEAELGEPLEAGYRAFLAKAAGWRAFYQAVDLFGPNEFLGRDEASRDRWRRASEVVTWLGRDLVFEKLRLLASELFPIGCSVDDLDIFLMGRASGSFGGRVIWIAGQEIERFENFQDFFLSMIDYNRREIDIAKKRAAKYH